MTILSGVGIVLSLVFGGLLIGLAAELYYLLWWKNQRINSNNRVEEEEDNCSNHAKELFYLFCWDKPTSVNPTNSSEIAVNPEPNFDNDQNLELGLGSRSRDLFLKALGEDGVDLQDLVGPPRFLFTIKEETKEDLDSEDGKSRSKRRRSLSDLIMASPPLNCNTNNYNNPLFESEINRLRCSSSPPPKLKFLRDAEEKLYRKLVEEALNKSAVSEKDVL